MEDDDSPRPYGGLDDKPADSMKDDLKGQREEILDRATMADVADWLGLEPAGKKDRHCPAHPDQVGPGHRPNLHLYDKEAHCFVCGFHADAFGLVAKAKGLDFKGARDFLAGRMGLPLIGDYRKSGAKKGRGLGYKAKAMTATVYPKPVKLPDSPSPTLGASNGGDLGNDDQVEGAKAYPNGDQVSRDLPVELWRDFDDFASAMTYLGADQVAGFRRALGYDKEAKVYFVRRPTPPRYLRRRSLRVEVFDTMLRLATPSSPTPAGDWLHREKGISPATQDAFGLRWLEDPRTVAGELIKTYGLDRLLDFGIYGLGQFGKPYFIFKTHRLLFPFYWKGEPVDIQGRDPEADKNRRFRNTGGKNPIPYNADDLVEARRSGAPVFVCEGATDTLALSQSGRLVAGIVGTGGFKSAWLPYFADLDVYLAFDGDQAGREAAKKVSTVFVEAGHRAPKVIRLPDGVKDINEFFRSLAK